MPRIEVLSDRGLHHVISGFHAWVSGVYDFPDDERFDGWLKGQYEAGTCRPNSKKAQAEFAKETEAAQDQPDYQALSNKELLALIDERGLEAPKRANKEQLVGILTASADVKKNEDAPPDAEVKSDAPPVAESHARTPEPLPGSHPSTDHTNMPDALPRGSAR